MPLPITKTAFNRLGDRLIATERPAESDLEELALALTAYQDVLEGVKAHLRDLGFAPTGRVKTTPTMTDKLRRTHGMELSRMQDVAGARIVVRDLAAQDEAKDKISDFYSAQHCPWREVDRRKDPRFGYKAVHLVVRVDDMPVEIQIRTELQDTWAQIVERLADRWGRGIRYGEAPENPEGTVRSGELIMSRREALDLLMTLSDSISAVESVRRSADVHTSALKRLEPTFEVAYERGDPERLANKIPPEMVPSQEGISNILRNYAEELDAEGQGLLAAGADMTGAQLVRMAAIVHGLMTRDVSHQATQLAGYEQQLRDTLQVIAGVTDEGE
jgi:ppGpp synthetase/RelA/SpoT-type nucleotidyltranferase